MSPYDVDQAEIARLREALDAENRLVNLRKADAVVRAAEAFHDYYHTKGSCRGTACALYEALAAYRGWV